MDINGLVAFGAPVNKPDMPGVPNVISGWPATSKTGFNTVGYPGAKDPTLTAADPSSIANLAAWYKASDFDNTADGTEVVQWNDHSSFNRPVNAVGSAGSRQTVSRNSINSSMTSIGGTAKRGFISALATAGMPLASINTYTLFAVVSFSSLNAASENNFCGITNNALIIRVGINNTGPGDFNLVYPNVGNFRSTTALTVTTWHYIILEDSADTETTYVDGSALTWNSQPGTPSGNSVTDIRPLDDGNTGPFRGLCAELGFYDRALTSGERTTLYTYFQQRYNLP